MPVHDHRNPHFDDAHRQVLVSKGSPDTPLRTSDIYLESLLREASRQRGVPPDGAIDELLYESWRDPGRWEPEIPLLDRISESYGYFSPRLLGELDWNSDALEKAGQAFGSYNNAWQAAYYALNRQNLQRFVA